MRNVKKNSLNFNIDSSNEYFDLFWTDVEKNIWEQNTFKILDRYVNKDSYVLDIGAWIGPVTLYAAAIGAKVDAFEPDPVAYDELIRNINVNDFKDKISVYKECINDVNGVVEFGNVKNAWGNSGSSMLHGHGFIVDTQCSTNGEWQVSYKVKAVTLDDFLASKQIDKVDFIKIDIEGGESKVVPTLKNIIEKYHPTIHLSVHTPFFSNVNIELSQIVNTFNSYCIYDSSGQKINSQNLLNMTGFYDIVCAK